MQGRTMTYFIFQKNHGNENMKIKLNYYLTRIGWWWLYCLGHQAHLATEAVGGSVGLFDAFQGMGKCLGIANGARFGCLQPMTKEAGFTFIFMNRDGGEIGLIDDFQHRLRRCTHLRKHNLTTTAVRGLPEVEINAPEFGWGCEVKRGFWKESPCTSSANGNP
ncbi:Hypothetical predicted protein [Olea europaea subsp. europaea]|uniref:Uncharacterized protein n=1 Tax=Olea europaea subsp. europaea TaxID=158383 RepID=A0A8S0Q8F5_OLEEU|nr:Hypothetical predicted protein [Olea europaea subsp. europaea]